MQKSTTTRPVAAAPRPAAPRPVEPVWAADLRRALREVDDAAERHRHATARLPVVIEEERAARAALSKAEASEALEYAGVSVDGVVLARQRLDAAEAEVWRAERIEAALREQVEKRRATLVPLIDDARAGLAEWTEAEMRRLDAEFAEAMQHVVAIAARAASIADAAGAEHLIAPIFRARLPGSLLRAEVAVQIGTFPGMTPPEPSPRSAQAEGLRALLVAATHAAAAQPEAEASRRAA